MRSTSNRCCSFVAKEQTKSIADTLILTSYDEASIQSLAASNQLAIAVYQDNNLIVNDGISDATLNSSISYTNGIFQTSENLNGNKYIVCYEDAGDGHVVKVSYPEAKANGTAMLAFSTNAILLFILFLIFIVPSIPISNRINKALDITLKQIDEIAEGNLNITIDEKVKARHDELGSVQESIEHLCFNLKGLIHNIDDSSNSLGNISKDFGESFDTIVTSIKDVNIAMEEIAKGATSQANESSLFIKSK